MTQLTRRQMLATAAVATLAPMGHLPAHGAAPLIGKQAPSYYRYKVGSYEVTVVSDGARSWPLDIVRNATKEEVSTALAAAYLDKEKVTFPRIVNYAPHLPNDEPADHSNHRHNHDDGDQPFDAVSDGTDDAPDHWPSPLV